MNSVLVIEFQKLRNIPQPQYDNILCALQNIVGRVDTPDLSERLSNLLADFYEIQQHLTDGEYMFFAEGLCSPKKKFSLILMASGLPRLPVGETRYEGIASSRTRS